MLLHSAAATRSDLFGSSKFYMDEGDKGHLKETQLLLRYIFKNPLQFPISIEERQVINEVIIYSCAGIT